jgi:hypothetical protein
VHGPRPQRWLGPVHSARGPRLAGPASACAARDGAAQRASACRSGHHSLGMRHGVAGGSATAAEAEQKAALEHPRRRGYPPVMGVDAIAHWSSLSMGRGRKTGSAVMFSDEARAPVAGGGPVTGRRRRVSGGGGAEMTTAPGGTAHLARWRPVTAASARRSDSSGGEPQTAGRRLRNSEREVRRRRGKRGTVGTPALGPDRALKARERRGAARACGSHAAMAR